MKSCKLQIVELDSDSRRLLYDLTEQMREATNFVWRQWEAWHTERDSQTALKACLERDRQWRETKQGKRPKWDVQPWPKEFANDLYHKCTRRFPGINSRALVLLLNRLRGNITTKQSSAANTKWWIAILLDKDGRGVARHAQPLLFDSANAKVRPSDEKWRVWLDLRLDRIARQGKRGTSTPIRAALKTGGKRAAYALPALQMAAGTRKLGGAQIIYDARKRKWFAALAYEPGVKEQPKLSPKKTAVLRPGFLYCWWLRIDGRSWWLGGRGHHVAHKRKSLLLQRLSRQHSYTFAPPRKGHGKDRALGPVFKLTLAWRNFTRACNDELTTEVVRRAAEAGCGRIVLVGGHSERVLSAAGKLPDHDDATGWPWHQVEQLLEQKANRLGIQVAKREFCGGKYKRQPEVPQNVKTGTGE